MYNQKLADGIVGLLRKSDGSLNKNQISKMLQIKSESQEYIELEATLEMLIEQEVIEKSARRKYSLIAEEESNQLIGKLTLKEDDGVVETDNEEFPKVIVRHKSLGTAFNGDTVEVQLLAQKKNKKPKGEVVCVIERAQTTIIGTVEFDEHFYFLVPEDKNFYVDFIIPVDKLAGARHGDKVIGSFLEWENPQKSPKAAIKQVIGRAGDPVVEYESIIEEFELPKHFPDAVDEEARKFKAPTSKVPEGRRDLLDELIITIDPIDAKDFDDALSLDILENGNYKLGVHIADVSHYVTENSALDIESRMRGNSIYLVDRVIPMLPEALSNEICSLKPGVPRFAFTVFMELSPKGALKDYEIVESLIENKRRYHYDEVQDILDTGKGDNAEFLIELSKLSKILKAKRYKSGGIEFDTTEVKFVLDENRYPSEVKLRRTTDATSLVEEFMLLANQTVAQHVRLISKTLKQARILPYLFRVHEEPDQKMLREALDFISTFGPKLKVKQVGSKEINQLLKDVEELPEKSIVHSILIRSMPKAIYSYKNVGHFGLGFKEYSHFTSPIRRYPDLIVHRMIKEYAKGAPSLERVKFLNMLMKDVGTTSSERERKAMEAERASNKLAHTMMADHHVGESFTGTISGVMPFGVFVTLDELYAEGLLHIRDIGDDYYVYDEANYRIIGRRSKKVYNFGKKIRVKIKRVSIEDRKIDLTSDER